jgi:hypothetical protein
MKSITTFSAAAFLLLFMPFSAFAMVEYGAWYHTPQPYSQTYYQPMYAYAYAPAQQGSQNTYINYGYPQQYSYNYAMPSYNSYSYPQQYQYPQYNSYPSYNSYPYSYGYPSYGGGYGYGPSGYGYPTGDTAPWIGGQLCNFPDYNGRALCGSNPNQWVYDPWTGSWY